MLHPERWKVNRERMTRLHRLEDLQVRPRKPLCLHRGPAPRPTGLGERWSMDFVRDPLAGGRAFRALTVIDNWSRETLWLEAVFQFPGDSIAAATVAGRTAPTAAAFDHCRLRHRVRVAGAGSVAAGEPTRLHKAQRAHR